MYKVNIEDEPEIAQQFGARSIPYMAFISKSGDISAQAPPLNPDSALVRVRPKTGFSTASLQPDLGVQGER